MISTCVFTSLPSHIKVPLLTLEDMNKDSQRCEVPRQIWCDRFLNLYMRVWVCKSICSTSKCGKLSAIDLENVRMVEIPPIVSRCFPSSEFPNLNLNLSHESIPLRQELYSQCFDELIRQVLFGFRGGAGKKPWRNTIKRLQNIHFLSDLSLLFLMGPMIGVWGKYLKLVATSNWFL